MSKDVPISSAFRFPSKKELVNLKTKSARSNEWFEVSQKIERILFNLKIRLGDTMFNNVKSSNGNQPQGCYVNLKGTKLNFQVAAKSESN